MYMDIDEVRGVESVLALPSNEIERMEGLDKENPAYIQYQWNSRGMTFENWQVAHFRILGNDKYAPYGMSVLEPVRRVWRQLCVAKGERVLTPFGYKVIESVKAGDAIFCYDPDTDLIKETQVVAQKSMGLQCVYELKTSHRTLKVTDKHGMLVYSDGEYVYKQAKEIEIKMILLLQGHNRTKMRKGKDKLY